MWLTFDDDRAISFGECRALDGLLFEFFPFLFCCLVFSQLAKQELNTNLHSINYIGAPFWYAVSKDRCVYIETRHSPIVVVFRFTGHGPVRVVRNRTERHKKYIFISSADRNHKEK